MVKLEVAPSSFRALSLPFFERIQLVAFLDVGRRTLTYIEVCGIKVLDIVLFEYIEELLAGLRRI